MLGTHSTKNGIRLGPKSLKTGKVRHSFTKQRIPISKHTDLCTKAKSLISDVLHLLLYITPKMVKKRTLLTMLEAMEDTGLSKRLLCL